MLQRVFLENEDSLLYNHSRVIKPRKFNSDMMIQLSNQHSVFKFCHLSNNVPNSNVFPVRVHSMISCYINCHVSLVSFILKQLLSLSLCFLTLTFLVGSDQFFSSLSLSLYFGCFLNIGFRCWLFGRNTTVVILCPKCIASGSTCFSLFHYWWCEFWALS